MKSEKVISPHENVDNTEKRSDIKIDYLKVNVETIPEIPEKSNKE